MSKIMRVARLSSKSGEICDVSHISNESNVSSAVNAFENWGANHGNTDIYNIEIGIKDYKFREAKKQRKFCNFKRTYILNPETLTVYINALFKYCLTHRVDSYRIHLDRLKGTKLLLKITARTDYNDLTLAQVVGIIWSSISVAHHFHLRFATAQRVNRTRMKQYQAALYAFERVLTLLLPQLFTAVMEAIVKFINESRLWDLEPFIVSLFNKLLLVNKNTTAIINHLLDILKSTNVTEARNLIKILYCLMKNIVFYEMDESLMYRMLDTYKKMVNPTEEDDESYWILKKSFEVCVRHMLINMKASDVSKMIKCLLEILQEQGLSEEDIIEYGSLIEFAATLPRKKLVYSDYISEEMLMVILQLISSADPIINLIGTRTLQALLDNHNNMIHLRTPTLFMQNTKYKQLVIPDTNMENKNFMKQFRQRLHASLLDAVKLHGENIVNLESIYTCIALITVEVPCGFTASAMVCLVMSIQEKTIENTDLKLDVTNRIHALVISVMTLIAYVNEANAFYEYLNTIIARRAELAPHMSPPLLHSYEYSQHHVIWCKEELFFEDWEVRFGLWNKFVTRK